ncbi:metallophosphoesterase [Sulfurimonas sp.]|uniref:metallophosphoesterase n=1 Tax=Sulfurimonas sp. TaxID=2022749 RepID=UPI003568A682
MKINILHFSDLHYDSKNKTKMETLKTKMIDSLQKSDPVDLVVFSGDLVQKPSVDELNNAYTEFIEPLLLSLNLTVNECFFTIGNHEVFLDKRDDITFSGLRDYVIDKNDKKTIAALQNEERELKEFVDYKEFIDSLKQDTVIKNHTLYTIYKKTVHGITFGCISLNSSIFMEGSKHDFTNLWLIPDMLDGLAKEIRDCDIKTLNIHHSLRWFKNHNEIEKIMLDRFNIVFYGHEHEHDGKHIMDIHNRDILSLHASSLFHEKNERDGYCCYLYDSDNSELIIKKNEFNKKQIIFEEFQENIINNIDLMKKAPNTVRNQHICAVIYPVLQNHVNQYLSINLTSENNKKCLEDIFVHPIIVEIEDVENEGKQEEKEETQVLLEDVIKSEENTLFLGKGESGKTTILNMLNLMHLKSHTGHIPIYISGNELNNENSIALFKAKISDYLGNFYGDTKLRLEDMINQKRFVFLIDDIDKLSDELVSKIIALDNIIFATFTTKEYDNFEDNILNFSKESNLYNVFNRLKIKPLRAKESKRLTENIVMDDKSSSIATRVTKTISKLSLPSNPFITTLLAWMYMEKIEIRENEPQIIDVFLDYLLEKSDLSKRFEGKFDFDDKKNLLSFIAYKFFTEESLAIKEDKIMESIISYSSKYYAFNIDATDILNYFYERKIITKNNGLVQFSYRVFYYYFIALYMKQNEIFYETVTSDKKYIINMINELRYYAALNKNDKKILDTIISYLGDAKFLNKIISLPALELLTKEKSHPSKIDNINITHDEDEDEDENSVTSSHDKKITDRMDNIKTEIQERKSEDYNKNKILITCIDRNYREEFFALNLVLAEFVKNLSVVKIEEKQDYLLYVIDNYVNIFRYWEKTLSDKEVIKKFLNITLKDDTISIDDDELETLKTHMLNRVLATIAQIVEMSLATPKMTNLYVEGIRSQRDVYSYFFNMMLNFEVGEEYIIENFEHFIRINKNKTLFKLMFNKLLHSYVHKINDSEMKKSIKKLLIKLQSTIHNVTLDKKGKNMRKLQESVEHRIKIMQLLA